MMDSFAYHRHPAGIPRTPAHRLLRGSCYSGAGVYAHFRPPWSVNSQGCCQPRLHTPSLTTRGRYFDAVTAGDPIEVVG